MSSSVRISGGTMVLKQAEQDLFDLLYWLQHDVNFNLGFDKQRNTPEHWNPLPVNPTLQKQVNEPWLLLQVASELQPPLLVWHSLISETLIFITTTRLRRCHFAHWNLNGVNCLQTRNQEMNSVNNYKLHNYCNITLFGVINNGNCYKMNLLTEWQ